MGVLSRYNIAFCRRAVEGRRVWLGVTALLAAFALAGCAGQMQMPGPVGLTAAPSTAVTYNSQAPFSVGVIPTKAPPVRFGEELGFRLSTSRSGYGHVYLLNASGRVLVLTQNLPLTKDVERVFPALGEGFIFRASPPAGMERVLFLVTRQPFAGFGITSGSGMPVQLPVRAHDFIRELNAATALLPDQDWALVESRIEIIASEG